VELTSHAPDHGMHRIDLRLSGTVANSVTALLDGLEKHQTWADGAPAQVLRRLRHHFSAGNSWGPHAVFDALETGLPHDATVTVDSGAHRILLSQKLRMSRPNALLQSAGLCTMGAAMPLAIGYAAARPGAPVVAVLGDGGLEMCLGELGTLRDQGLPIVIVVLQDHSLALIELKQCQAGLDRTGVDLGATRYEEIAAAFCGHGVRVAGRAEFEKALADALSRQTFTLIACEIEANDYAGRI
jgi:acetolactate synthase-1/2/3 large subunit